MNYQVLATLGICELHFACGDRCSQKHSHGNAHALSRHVASFLLILGLARARMGFQTTIHDFFGNQLRCFGFINCGCTYSAISSNFSRLQLNLMRDGFKFCRCHMLAPTNAFFRALRWGGARVDQFGLIIERSFGHCFQRGCSRSHKTQRSHADHAQDHRKTRKCERTVLHNACLTVCRLDSDLTFA